ncbi:hypothetical protein KBC03_01590 [Patescibacteria group bacterium]|nr:hypothetical protein [Patescibacteria group bacterium]
MNADEKDGSLGGDCLDIDFATPEEAIKVANLVNFYKAVYSGYGSKWSKAFNISSVQDGLEFAKNGFGPSKWFDLNALGNKTAVDIYSPELNAQGLEIFKDWLNSLQDR